MAKKVDPLREARVLDLLKARRSLGVVALAKELDSSVATIRRDLGRLEARGLLVRTHGGAQLRELTSIVSHTLEQKRLVMRREKERIARRAAELVRPGMRVALDSGSTTWRVAAHLKGKAPLFVVTTALTVIEELGAVEGITLFTVGGQFHRDSLAFLGGAAEAAFSSLRVDLAFLAADCLIPGRGVFADTPEEANLIRAMARCADRCVVVADHSKLNRQGLFQALPPSMIQCVITDSGLEAKSRALLAKGPWQLLVA